MDTALAHSVRGNPGVASDPTKWFAAIALTYLNLRESREPNATRVDWSGVATSNQLVTT